MVSCAQSSGSDPPNATSPPINQTCRRQLVMQVTGGGSLHHDKIPGIEHNI